jgi:hypothetical protein
MSGNAVCRDVIMVSDVVARLRLKVKEGVVDTGSNAVLPPTHPWLMPLHSAEHNAQSKRRILKLTA